MNVLQCIGAVAAVALHADVVDAGLAVGHVVYQRGVLAAGIHELGVAVHHVCTLSIGHIHAEPAQSQRTFGLDTEHGSPFLRHVDPVPVHRVGIVVVVVAQLSGDGRSALQRHRLLPGVVRLGVGLGSMAGEIAGQAVAAVAAVALHAHIVGADSHVGHFVYHRGVLAAGIHKLGVAVHHVCTLSIGHIHAEPAQSQRWLRLYDIGQLTLFGHLYLVPVVLVGVLIIVVAHPAVGRSVELHILRLAPRVVVGSIGTVAVGSECVGQLVAAGAAVALQTHIVDAGLTVGHVVYQCGVLAAGIHELGVAVHHVRTLCVGHIHAQPAQSQLA